MSTTMTTRINIDCSATSTKNGRETKGFLTRNRSFANGTGANQADKCYYDQITIAATGSAQNLDFAGGGLIDLNGDAITWVEMVGLAIYNADMAISIVVGNGTNPLNFGCGATGTKTLMPGETAVLINTGTDPGYPIAAGSTDNLKLFIASGTNIVCEVWAVGRSA